MIDLIYPESLNDCPFLSFFVSYISSFQLVSGIIQRHSARFKTCSEHTFKAATMNSKHIKPFFYHSIIEIKINFNDRFELSKK